MKNGRNAIVVTLGILAFLFFGCRKTETIATPDTCPGGPASGYGSGHLAFILSAAGDTFNVSGPYKPSSRFGNDSSGKGAGGYHLDTLIGTRTISGEIMSYLHTFNSFGLNERVMVFTLSNPGGSMSIGNYQLVSVRANPAGMIARAHYHIFSDSLGQYLVFEARSGVLSIASYDSCSGHTTGTFTGTLQGSLPDTTTQIQLTNGVFDVTLVHRYFPF